MPESYILIGADIVPTESNVNYFKKGDVVSLVGEELGEILRTADFRMFNLEVPLCDQPAPITKLGPHLIAPTAAINGYSGLGVNLLTLANNHILDHGVQGLKSTLDVLESAGIAYVGIGVNLAKASKPYIFKFVEKNIGVYACSEHEFSIAREDNPGANPFDPLCSLDHIEALKKVTDYVIVLYHGGKEHYRYPSPNLYKICRRMVDKGADLVVCQHSHCIGCEDKYAGGTIVYGQGNFIFDGSKRECWQTSLLIKLDKEFKVTYLPIVKQYNRIRIADEKEKNEIMSAFIARSEEIKMPGAIKNHYSEFAEGFLPNYLRVFAGERSILFKVINRISRGRLIRRYIKKTYRISNMVSISNYIDCEAHRELLSQGLANHYWKGV